MWPRCVYTQNTGVNSCTYVCVSLCVHTRRYKCVCKFVKRKMCKQKYRGASVHIIFEKQICVHVKYTFCMWRKNYALIHARQKWWVRENYAFRFCLACIFAKCICLACICLACICLECFFTNMSRMYIYEHVPHVYLHLSRIYICEMHNFHARERYICLACIFACMTMWYSHTWKYGCQFFSDILVCVCTRTHIHVCVHSCV